MAEQLINLAVGTLGAGIDADDLALTINDLPSWVPTSGNWRLNIDGELLLVESRSGTTVTIASGGRGIESTTAASHLADATVSVVLTAAGLTQAMSEAIATHAAASDPHTGYLRESWRAFARKTADETVNNSAVLQDDDHLSFAIGANEVWTFQLMLMIVPASSGTPDFKYAFSVPSGASGNSHVIGPAQATTNPQDTNVTCVFTAHGNERELGVINGQNNAVLLQGIVVNGANAGTVQFRWAQVNATAENTVLRADSYLVAERWA